MLDRELLTTDKFSLVMRDAVLPDGLRVTASVIRHPGAAAIIALFDDLSVLLIRQFRIAIGDWIWEIPAGTLRSSETPSECARRELREETGYLASQVSKVGEFLPVPDYSDDLVHLFLATDLSPTSQELDSDEVIEVSRIPLAVALEMVRSGDIRDAKTMLALLTIHFRVHQP